MSLLAQEPGDGPTNEKTLKTYKRALDYLHKHDLRAAFEDFKMNRLATALSKPSSRS
jgi:hypothetical protein